jgi:apolipoprotein N-acyltransferase
MDILVTIHLIVAIAVVLATLISLITLLRGGWSDTVGTWMNRLALLATAQWVLGFFVWFGAIGEGFNAFTGLLHPVAMTGVLGLAHAANARAKGEADLAKRASGARTFLLIITALLVLLVPWQQVLGGEEAGEGGGMGGGSQIANPASEFCEQQGGTLEIVDEAGGQVGYCTLPDGTRIEEWEYYRSMNPDATSPTP